jgi:hypothetical protein
MAKVAANNAHQIGLWLLLIGVGCSVYDESVLDQGAAGAATGERTGGIGGQADSPVGGTGAAHAGGASGAGASSSEGGSGDSGTSGVGAAGSQGALGGTGGTVPSASGGRGGGSDGGIGGSAPTGGSDQPPTGGTGPAVTGGTGPVATGGTGGLAAGGTSNEASGGTDPTTTGGGDGTGGATGGAPACGGLGNLAGASGTLPVTTDMIDDLEDGDDRILVAGSPPRDGYWYTYGDVPETGTWQAQLLPGADSEVPDGCHGTTQCIYALATGWNGDVGAGVGVDLNSQGEEDKQPYDASGFDGIVFWARGSAAPGQLLFKALTTPVVPPAEGGACNTSTSTCYDAHFTAVEVTADWRRFWIQFCELEQVGWGDPQVDFDPGDILSLQFQVNAGEDFSMELWLDYL